MRKNKITSFVIALGLISSTTITAFAGGNVNGIKRVDNYKYTYISHDSLNKLIETRYDRTRDFLSFVPGIGTVASAVMGVDKWLLKSADKGYGIIIESFTGHSDTFNFDKYLSQDENTTL